MFLGSCLQCKQDMHWFYKASVSYRAVVLTADNLILLVVGLGGENWPMMCLRTRWRCLLLRAKWLEPWLCSCVFATGRMGGWFILFECMFEFYTSSRLLLGKDKGLPVGVWLWLSVALCHDRLTSSWQRKAKAKLATCWKKQQNSLWAVFEYVPATRKWMRCLNWTRSSLCVSVYMYIGGSLVRFCCFCRFAKKWIRGLEDFLCILKNPAF